MSSFLAGEGECTEPLRVQVRRDRRAVTVAISGELDYATAPVLAARLAEALAGQPACLIFDLAGLAFIDCTGAGLIARARKRLPAGAQLILRDPRPAARRLFRLTGLDQFCDIART